MFERAGPADIRGLEETKPSSAAKCSDQHDVYLVRLAKVPMAWRVFWHLGPACLFVWTLFSLQHHVPGPETVGGAMLYGLAFFVILLPAGWAAYVIGDRATRWLACRRPEVVVATFSAEGVRPKGGDLVPWEEIINVCMHVNQGNFPALKIMMRNPPGEPSMAFGYGFYIPLTPARRPAEEVFKEVLAFAKRHKTLTEWYM